jgi:hypothetical protein
VGKIAGTLQEKGAKGVTARMCRDKFKNLKARYKQIQSRQKSTGAAGETKWPFWNAMDDLLRKDVAVNPDNIIEAGAAGYRAIKRRWV